MNKKCGAYRQATNSIMNSYILTVCPDDLGALGAAQKGFLCSQCGRLFPVVAGIHELLPLEMSAELAAARKQMDAYQDGFSTRPEKAWRRSLAHFLNRLGNGYLYNWVARTLKESFDENPQAILDAACGDGSLRSYLRNQYSYTGVDFSMRLLARANRYNPSSYFRADLNHLPFPSDAFDTVVCLQALQYLEHPEIALAQFARVLRPGGTLLLSVPNSESLKYRIQGIPKIQLQTFTRGTLPAILTESFEILEMHPRGMWLPIPKISLHLPGTYSATWGLSWTIVA
jgi:ubiquinone/menaquinone biosynthesis C-methylase UbiE/uncharacterized protein YbaR (Trm112 family)